MTSPPELTPQRIQHLLRAAPDLTEAERQDYQRLMEVYCVVKSGGVVVQRQAALAFQRREQQRLQREMAELEPALPSYQALAQEQRDLEETVRWRLEFLDAIATATAAVAASLAAIEAHLAPRPSGSPRR